MVVAKDDKTLKGTMVVCNADKDSLTNNKNEVSHALTQKVQDGGQNPNSKVSVTDVRQTGNGDLVLDYECTGTSNQETAKKTLKNTVNQDDVKNTINKSKKTNAATTKSQPTTTQQSKFYS